MEPTTNVRDGWEAGRLLLSECYLKADFGKSAGAACPVEHKCVLALPHPYHVLVVGHEAEAFKTVYDPPQAFSFLLAESLH
ncbi:hypothetical protein FV222_05400 [Methylobacterium sp. WL103]|uniref:hypothetical protein n=1 Tax=Methylobacterium TaxID=407 RepID=UPI0011C77CC0|nr:MULTISPECIES: hypothetical protein [Methylobacterium]TXM73387.1 hypothetical protein FV226_09230 [Methylobacterium sp. WL12]TXN06502.1 hypothetical protein FV222_05400 [Methylobacterium sp. WL103]TXN12199.1 hypothetical protein FV219_05270 [Methylobacterium sp. WL122]